MKENFSTACRFIGALVFSLSIISVPVTATTLAMSSNYNASVFIPFLAGTIIETVTLTIILFKVTSTNDNKTVDNKPAKTVKKRGEKE